MTEGLRREIADASELDEAQAEATAMAERLGCRLSAWRTVNPTEDGRLVVEWGLEE